MLKVKEARLKRGMSQAELEKRSGVSQAAISCIELGTRTNVGIKTLEALARALECPLNEIYQPDTVPAA